MNDKIIALVDGSIYSASVCDHAAWASKRSNLSVELMHVLGRRVDTDKTDLSGAIKLGARTTLLEELSELDEQRAKLLTQHARAILDDARDIVEKDGVSDVTTRKRYGDLVECVEQIEGDARFILIGKRGEHADFAKGHLGSNLERIARASHKPVLVASRTFNPIEKVLIAYDGGQSGQKIITHLMNEPLYKGLDLHLACVGVASAQSDKALADACATLSSAGLTVSGENIEGHPQQVLGELVDSAHYHMVVMGAYRHSRVRSFILGSTTTEMIRTCKVPLVLIR